MFHSKQILNAKGYLSIDFSFKVMEIKRKTFFTSGTSKVTNNVKANQKKIMKNAIYNGVKKKFPNRSITPYQIIILSYDIIYLEDRYQVIGKKNKKGKTEYYERYRDKENKRTRYSKISSKKEYIPEQQGYD